MRSDTIQVLKVLENNNMRRIRWWGVGRNIKLQQRKEQKKMRLD
jgi:hypothetical protein